MVAAADTVESDVQGIQCGWWGSGCPPIMGVAEKWEESVKALCHRHPRLPTLMETMGNQTGLLAELAWAS